MRSFELYSHGNGHHLRPGPNDVSPLETSHRLRLLQHTYCIDFTFTGLLALIGVRFGTSLRYIELPCELITPPVLHELANKVKLILFVSKAFTCRKFYFRSKRKCGNNSFRSPTL